LLRPWLFLLLDLAPDVVLDAAKAFGAAALSRALIPNRAWRRVRVVGMRGSG